ncbi:hypothetical protein XELAEV_18000671mg [Xenopus laevis]|nr:hypothetical protein XELAEV_18000671mg [Xenopus laevis]
MLYVFCLLRYYEIKKHGEKQDWVHQYSTEHPTIFSCCMFFVYYILFPFPTSFLFHFNFINSPANMIQQYFTHPV